MARSAAMPYAGKTSPPRERPPLPLPPRGGHDPVTHVPIPAHAPPRSAPSQPSSQHGFGLGGSGFGQASRMLEQPSVEDLFALYRLCGGDAERVIELLARLWNTDAAAIAPTVRAWLGDMPSACQPPSRTRTAPPVLPSWFMTPRWSGGAPAASGLARNGVGGGGLGGGGRAVPVSAPAVDRPLQRSFDMAALQQAVRKGEHKLPPAQRTRTLTLQPMPEDGPMDFSAAQWMTAPAAAQQSQARQPHFGLAPSGAPAPGGDDALGAFMYASRMGRGELRPMNRTNRGGAHMR